MTPDYWHRQTIDKPLFSELLWSRPENKQFAGKLTVIGGNLHGFAAPAEAYGESFQAGVGLTRVLLPEAVKKLVGPLFETVEFAPSNPSGSFSQKALEQWLSLATWSDGVLLAGDLGRNSETAIVLEKFINKYHGRLIITKDAADYAIPLASTMFDRPDTTWVVSMAQLQKLAIQAGSIQAVTLNMDLLRLVDVLHTLTTDHAFTIVTKHHDTLYTAHGGRVSTTKLHTDMPVWRVKVAAHVAVWQIQNPSKPFEAATTAVLQQ
jgi:hypothetical protein